MKHSSFSVRVTQTLLITVALAIIAGVATAIAQSGRNRAIREFMRSKLELSQRVLEGLATEDFELIISRGTKLSAMSKEAGWRAFENPDYDQQSAIFRRHVDSLVKAAKDKNLEAATLAYVRMTMSCVDCHKLVRGKLVAASEEGRGMALLAQLNLGETALPPRNGQQSPNLAKPARPGTPSLVAVRDR